MVKDPANGIIPENAVTDAVDVFFDVPSKVRRRGVTTKPVGASTSTATAVAIGVGGGTNGYTYGLKIDGTIGFLNEGNGTFTAVSGPFASSSFIGKPVSFFGILMFPTYGAGLTAYIPSVYRADDTGFSSYSPPAATNAFVTAGSNVVGFTNGDFAANTQANGGQFVIITDSSSSATRNIYIGTFQAAAPHTIVVDPIPTKSFTATQGVNVGTFVSSAYAAFNQPANPNAPYGAYNGRSLAVHQNRVLIGGASRLNISTSQIELYPRSVFYSILPKDEPPSGNVNAQGHAWFFAEGIEANNRFDIGGSDPILALAPIDDNELLIFTASRAWRLTGYLSTRTTNDAGGVTFDVHVIPDSPGFLTSRSMQQTPHGLVFAGRDDLYLYSRGVFQPLLGRANGRYWQSLLTNRSILGSHILDPHTYVVSVGTDGFDEFVGGGDTQTFAFHIPTRSFSRLTGDSLVLFDSVLTSSDPFTRLGLRWWDASLTAPSMAGSPLAYTGFVTSPNQLGSFDSDGHTFTPSITTRVYDEGSPDQKKRFWRSVWRVDGTATITVKSTEAIFSGAGASTIGTMGVRGFASYTGPVIHSPGVQYTISGPTADAARFDILGFDHYWDALPYARAS
jgi:hypothetical protein